MPRGFALQEPEGSDLPTAGASGGSSLLQNTLLSSHSKDFSDEFNPLFDGSFLYAGSYNGGNLRNGPAPLFQFVLS
jgi:hypothetical protein